MNAYVFIVVAWFTLGVLCAIGFLWFMKTHEEQLVDEIPDAQIFGCIPPPIKWLVILIMLFFGPIVLLWTVCEAINESRKEKDENDVPASPPVAAAAPVALPQLTWVVLGALFGAALIAYEWANAYPARPLATFLETQAWGIGFLLFMFTLSGAMGKGKFLHRLREPLYIVPFYLAAQVPLVAAMTVGWEGGWLLGIAGTAAGAAAGAAAGWLLTRWTVPQTENRHNERARQIVLPIAFAVLLAVLGAYSWAIEWLTPDDAWVIPVGWIFLSLPGILVGRPLLGVLFGSPFVFMLLVPLVASMTVGWEGGWVFGIAGAAVGAAAGAVKGWVFNRWIMPEYDKHRARESAVQPPDATDGPGSSGSMAEGS